MMPFIAFTMSAAVVLGRKAYQEVTFKIDKGASKDNLRDELQLQPFLEQHQIRKDCQVREVAIASLCEARGTNIGTISGDAAVYMLPNLRVVDKDAYNFILKHELSHIKHNDVVKTCSISIVYIVAAAALGMYLFGQKAMVTPVAFLLFGGSIMITIILLSQRQEAKADDFAIENSSPAELLGGRRFFKAAQNMNLFDERKKKIHLISQEGDYRMDVFHPSLTSRVQKIEQELAKRGALVIDDQEEMRKIEVIMKTINTNSLALLLRGWLKHSF